VSPRPGWYADPDAPGQVRYWDGSAWTAHRALEPPSAPALVVSDQRTSSVGVVVAWLLTLVTAGYFLPWAITETRGKSNSVAIGLINLLLGWTIIGWVVALIMACGPHRRTVVRGW
jgi:hypothetical protein